MLRECETCHKPYDDAKALTYCPHTLLRSAESEARWNVGFGLLGKRVAFAKYPINFDYNVRGFTFDGMVLLRELPGEFAPYLFIQKPEQG